MTDIIVKRIDGLFFGFHDFTLQRMPDSFLGYCFCIARIYGGSGVWRIGTENVDVKPGDLIFLNNIEYRRFLSGNITASCFWFSPGIYKGIDEGVCAELFYANGSMYTHVLRSEVLCDIYEKITDELKGPQSFALLTALTLELIFSSYREYKKNPLSLGKADLGSLTTAELIAESVRFIGEHLTEDINVSDAADSIGMSREHFSRSFKKFVTLSPGEYISRCRVTKFIDSYTEECSIVDLALDCGFTSVSGFYKTFNRVCGVSPKEYFARK